MTDINTDLREQYELSEAARARVGEGYDVLKARLDEYQARYEELKAEQSGPDGETVSHRIVLAAIEHLSESNDHLAAPLGQLLDAILPYVQYPATDVDHDLATEAVRVACEVLR